MKIIPTIKCKDMNESLSFYISVLDFELLGTWPTTEFSSFSKLVKEGCELHLSTHSGDGTFGNVVYVEVDEVDTLFKKFLERGLDISNTEESPVHQGPLDQTWGWREFYVNDPNGNTLRFGKPIAQ